MALKYYYDLMSQPSRAVYMFLHLNRIPYEDKVIALRKGEHRSKEYAKINPFHLVPVLDDNGFLLTESIAIVEYLASTRNVAEHWFPRSDLQKRARVNEYLHWHHLNLRANCATLFRDLLIKPRESGQPVNQQVVAKDRENVTEVIRKLENYFLRSTAFISSEEISVADLFAVNELMQLYSVYEENLYDSSPVVKAWIARVRDKTNPIFDNANQVVYRLRNTLRDTAKL